jgi:hypothetical protein
MRSGWRITAALGALALLAGCNHKRQNAILPIPAEAPDRPVSQMAELNPPMPSLPAYVPTRTVGLDTTAPAESKTEASETAPHHPRRRAKTSADTPPQQQEAAKPAAPAQAAPESPQTQIASVQPSENSPIGQISTASDDANTADRQTLTEQVNGTESALNGIHRSFSSDEQKTVALIRTFITRARQALKTDDLDGARNYSTKAKILLQELTKQ